MHVHKLMEPRLLSTNLLAAVLLQVTQSSQVETQITAYVGSIQTLSIMTAASVTLH